MGNRWENATWALNPDTTLLLTDGSIMVHDALRKRYWQRLRPNAHGDYRTSTDWTVTDPMHHSRL